MKEDIRFCSSFPEHSPRLGLTVPGRRNVLFCVLPGDRERLVPGREARAGVGAPACRRPRGILSRPRRPADGLPVPRPGRRPSKISRGPPPAAAVARCRPGAPRRTPGRETRSGAHRDEIGPPGGRRGALAGARSGSVPLAFAPVVGSHLAAAFISLLPYRSAEGADSAAVPGNALRPAGGAGGMVTATPERRRSARSPEIEPAGGQREWPSPERGRARARACVWGVGCSRAGRPALSGAPGPAWADRGLPLRGNGRGCLAPGRRPACGRGVGPLRGAFPPPPTPPSASYRPFSLRVPFLRC